MEQGKRNTSQHDDELFDKVANGWERIDLYLFELRMASCIERMTGVLLLKL